MEVAKLRRMDWVVGMWNCNVELQFLELSSVPGTELMSVPGGLWNCSSRSSRKGNFFSVPFQNWLELWNFSFLELELYNKPMLLKYNKDYYASNQVTYNQQK